MRGWAAMDRKLCIDGCETGCVQVGTEIKSVETARDGCSLGLTMGLCIKAKYQVSPFTMYLCHLVFHSLHRRDIHYVMTV